MHTVPSLIPVFRALANELIPSVETFNVLDESLLREAIADRTVTEALSRRVTGYLWAAQDAGAGIILVTCSSIGPAVDRGRALVSVPVVRVDEAMARRAVSTSHRIGVLATLMSTMTPTAELIGRVARDAGRDVELTSRLVEGAFERATQGDADGHDELIRVALEALMGSSEVVVLAQASMARAAATLVGWPDSIPILTSPRLAMEQVARMIDDGLVSRP